MDSPRKQHIPFYLNRFDEEPGYFNLPLKVRHHWLPRLFHAGARHVFSGHLHYNCTATWLPGPGISESLELVTTSSTGAQLGSDAPGFRLISLDPHSARLRHRYFALSEAEALVADGRSICIDS
ncbi:unnamed protein product [Protopolystoma xenopodis]|uniref:Calcineurin-like phosphoesterase domain-containing protein n=1 Tax=Protopolystoma xenopodis TaxID=117903 RepID=A0A3S5AEI6_9PLAT|nr:unnamed protein product [Protopolystoma xenopodis]